MKKIIGYVLLAAVLALPAVSSAAEFRTGKQATVRSDERINNDLYIAGGTVTSSGAVSGDLLAAGGTLVISGPVGSDAVVAGGNISIISSVGDDVRVAGGIIVIEGSVGGDVIAAGGQITLGGPGVAGDAALSGGNVMVNSPVAGKLTVKGGRVYINAPITGDILVDADSITLGSSAVISGNLTYNTAKALVKEPGAVVTGKLTPGAKNQNLLSPLGLAAILSAIILWKFVALLVASLIVGLSFRRYSRELVNIASKRSLVTLGRGLLVFAALPVISILLFVSLIGVPFGFLGLLLYAAGLLFSWIVTPIVIGSVVYKYFSKKDLEISWQTILLGTVISILLGFIPFVGWLILKLIFLLTLGAIDTINWQILKEWR